MTTTILPEPPAEEIQAETRTVRTKHRRKNTPKIKKSAEVISEQNIPAKTWLSAVSNLALLLAIFTIVFAAHRAIQNNQKQAAESPVAVTAEVPLEAEETTSQEEAAPQTNSKIIEESEAEKQIAEEPSPKEETIPIKKQKIVSKKQTTSSVDPYTDSGPLDLDRTKLNGFTNGRINDFANPWNSGGHLDLDNESARNEYKKHYLSSAESVNTPQ
ncbi:MAG: hypothetical protein HYY43_03345 [Deltaproteobacteria bacterium]|nr:hypothetical protein [Deltaproteobacteria bacterium]